MPYDKLIEKQVIYDGKKIRLEVHHLGNEEGKRIKKEICVHPGAVVVLPFLDEQTILLTLNKRYTTNQILVELPAGTLEKNEDPMNCGGRELLEETGYLAGRLKPLISFFTSPGILTERIHLFVAYNLEKQEQRLDESEEIEVISRTLDESIQMIHDGEIVDGKTIASLLYYDRFLRQK